MTVRGARHEGVVWTDRWNKVEAEREIRERFPHLLARKTNYTPGVTLEGRAYLSGVQYVITSTPLDNSWNSPRRYVVWKCDDQAVSFGEFSKLSEACLFLQAHLRGSGS